MNPKLIWRLLAGLVSLVGGFLLLSNVDQVEVFAFAFLPLSYPLLAWLVRLFMTLLFFGGFYLGLKSIRNPLGKYFKRVVGLLFIISLALPPVLSPPDSLYLKIYDYHAPIAEKELLPFLDIREADPYQLKGSTKLLSFFSPACHYCQLSARKLSILKRRYDISADKFQYVFFGNEGGVQAFYDLLGVEPIPYDLIPADKFLSITQGKMPAFVLLQEGQIVAYYGYRTLPEDHLATVLSNPKP